MNSETGTPVGALGLSLLIVLLALPFPNALLLHLPAVSLPLRLALLIACSLQQRYAATPVAPSPRKGALIRLDSS